MKGMYVFVIALLLMLLTLGESMSVFAAVEDDAKLSLDLAERKIVDCYEDVAEADEAGANVTDLVAVLEEKGWLLSKAKLACREGDFDGSLDLSTSSRNSLEGLMEEAWVLREEALERGRWDFMFGFVGSLVGGVVVVAGGVIVWFWLKRRIGVASVGEYGLLFVIVVGVMGLVVASPGLSRLLVYPRTEFLTEFWVLDRDGMAENYPFNISSEENYGLILGIGNQLGYCGYYMVEVKFRNESMPAPDSFNFTPSGLPSLVNISAFVADEDEWELPLDFSFGYQYIESASQVEVDNLTVNEVKSPIKDIMVKWDEKKKGHFGDLLFELWIFNGTTGRFEYHKRFLRLKLNLTVP